MSFLLIAIGSIVLLGIVAAILSAHDNEPTPTADDGHSCSACSSRADCKLADLMDKGKRTCTLLLILLTAVSCSTKKNTAKSRAWQSFTARYNTYYNGSQAFIAGSIEKESGNHDDYTSLLPLYAVANKGSRTLGQGNFERAIEKSQKTIRQHSIKQRPEWNHHRRKTQRDIEWLTRREYNPFLWHAWLLMGKSQFQLGQMEEAATTFSYMSRLYQTQPAIAGIARAWQAKSYAELGWIYDAEDIINRQRRDSMHYRAVKDWDYTYADFYMRSGRYTEAIPWLRRVIRHERRRKQKARQWYIMGQLFTLTGNPTEAYDAYRHVIRLNPPYELEFNARIAQTEVMPTADNRRKIARLRRMAASDNNKDFLDQVYYAIGNVHLARHDTLKAIEAYETGREKATRSGTEKGVLLLTLGDLYWQRQRFADAQSCYGEALGLLDRDRPGYNTVSARSALLDQLVPHTNAVELQDSLQRLAAMSDAQRNAIIDRIIDELKKKEREEQRAQQAAEAEQKLAEQSAVGNRNQTTQTTPTVATQQSGLWYFYNPQAVSQGKQAFRQQWGTRENADDWQRVNKTVVSFGDTEASEEETDSLTMADDTSLRSDTIDQELPSDSISQVTEVNDPHYREYYLAQIPFTEEQRAASDALIMDGLFQSGVIFKDKADILSLSESALSRLTTQYPAYERDDEALYHLFLLYSQQHRDADAARCITLLQERHPDSQWTQLLTDPLFAENQQFGEHIEDSLYAATYEAFRNEQHDIVDGNALTAATRFPQGAHQPKFLLIEGLSLLGRGRSTDCTTKLQQVVEQYPQSEVSELAGMILRGVQSGRQLQSGHYDIADIWSRRNSAAAANDSTQTADTLHFERNTSYVFLLAYQPDSINQNQLLYELARHNFSSYLVRNFDIITDQDANGLSRMLISGFLSYDEARQYARDLYATKGNISQLLGACRSLIISQDNLRLLGTAYSYHDYEVFFQQQIAPVQVSTKPLLEEPETIVTQPEEEEYDEENKKQPATTQPTDDDLFNNAPAQQQGGYIEFDDDFWR